MQQKSISELEKEYDLELERIVKTIKNNKCKNVLLQFPDGMKPYSAIIAREIEKKAGCECMVWFGSCFGACDIPNVEKVDLLIQFGHTEWKFEKK